jgi:hypothetical protein
VAKRTTSLLPRAKQLSPVNERKAKRAYLLAFTTVPQCQATDAMDIAGVTLGQLETWRINDQEFADLERQLGQQRADDTLRKQIDAYVAAGDRDIIKAAMKRLPEYNPAHKTHVEVTGEVKHKHLSGKTEAELDQIIRQAATIIDAEFEVVDDARAIAAPEGE